MKAASTIAALLCLALCTGALASAVSSAEVSLPAIDVEELPVALRQLQGDDVGDDLSHVVNKASHAVDAVKDIASTKIEGVQNLASESAEAAARAAKRIAKADVRLAGVIATTTKNTQKATQEAVSATATAAAVVAFDAITPNKGPLKKVAINVAKFATGINAKIQTKQAEQIAAKGAKRVKRATAKNLDSKQDAMEDAAEEAAHAARRAAIKAEIAKKKAAMAVGKVASAVLEP